MSKHVADHKLLTVLGLALFLLPLWSSRESWNDWVALLSIAAITGLAIWLLCRLSVRLVAMVVLVVLVLTAQWGVAQFIVQRDLGLHLIGESRLAVGTDGVAKFSTGDGKLIRAYGPFEHANILAGSLVLSLMLCVLLAIGKKPGESVLHYYAMAYALLIGIIVTFSRSAYLAVGLIALLTIHYDRRRVWHAFFIILLATVIVFSPLLSARFQDSEDRAAVERMAGARYAWGLVREQPMWSGAGFDYEEVLGIYLVRHRISFEPWQIDYVHSVPLLLAVQIGIGPTVLLFVVLLFITTRYYRTKWMWLLPLLVLLLFDHYMITQSAVLAYALVTYTLMPRFIS